MKIEKAKKQEVIDVKVGDIVEVQFRSGTDFFLVERELTGNASKKTLRSLSGSNTCGNPFDNISEIDFSQETVIHYPKDKYKLLIVEI